MKIIIIFLSIALISNSYATELEISEQELVGIVYEYREKYNDKTVSLDELAAYFGAEIREEHESHVAEGNRFSDLMVRWALNAPMELNHISKIYESSCDELDRFTRCLHIEGEDTTRPNKIKKIVLGFRQESDEWKIGAIFAKSTTGSYTVNYKNESEQ